MPVTQYFIKRQAVFLCENCGDTIQLFIPSVGNSSRHRYCCGFSYKAVTHEDGTFTIEQAEDNSPDKDDGPVPVMEARAR